MTRTNTSLSFGIMLDSFTVQKWQAETIKLLIDNGIILKCVILNDEEPAKQPFFTKIKTYPYKKTLFRVWNHYWFKPECKADTYIGNFVGNCTIIRCKTQKHKAYNFFSNEDIHSIYEQGLDFILRFGFDLIRGNILKTTHFGIWSFHHDDERIIRGGPPGFWEFMRGIPANGTILQSITSELDKGYIVKRIQFNTLLHSYKANLNQLYFGSECLPLLACREIQVYGKTNGHFSKSKAPIVHPPRNLAMLKYFWLCVYRKIKFHIHDLFRQEDWNVGYCNCSLENFLQERPSHKDIFWLKKPSKSQYLADPFVITTNKDTYIFFEWYSYKEGKSDIAVALKSENFSKYHKISNFKEHRSYPFVFSKNNTIYCIPEAYQTKKVILYRFDESDLSLKEDSVLLEGKPYVDPTLCFHDGKWFLFVSPQEQSHTNLEIFWSENTRGPYKPHLQNPVKIDCHGSRPAGKIVEINGRLTRPSQDSTAHYGQAIVMQEINELDEQRYKEEVSEVIFPFSHAKYDKGIHTINSDGKITVFDSKRFTFTFAGFAEQLRSKIRRKIC